MESFNTPPISQENNEAGLPENKEQIDENILSRAQEYQAKSKELDSLKMQRMSLDEEKQGIISQWNNLTPEERTEKRDAWEKKKTELPQKIEILENELRELQNDPELFEMNKRYNEKMSERKKIQDEYYARLNERMKIPEDQRPEDPEGEVMYEKLSQLTNEVNDEFIPLQDANRVKGPVYKEKFEEALRQIK